MQEPWMTENPFVFQYLGKQRYSVETPNGARIGEIVSTSPLSSAPNTMFFVPGVMGLHNHMSKAAHALVGSKSRATQEQPVRYEGTLEDLIAVYQCTEGAGIEAED
jgi:hypothetical protein